MKNFYVEIPPLAQSDIENALDYIAYELANPQAAVDLQAKFVKCFDNIKSFPLMGTELRANASLKRAYRWLSVDNYIVFYTVDDEQSKATVMRVLFGSSDYLVILKSN